MSTNERLYMALHLLGVEPEGVDSVDQLRGRLRQATEEAVQDWEWQRQRVALSDIQSMNKYALIAAFASEWWGNLCQEEWRPVTRETRLEPGNLLRHGGWNEPRTVSVLVAKYTLRPGGETYLLVPLLDNHVGSAVCSSGPLPGGAEYIEGITPVLRRGKYPRMTARFEYHFEKGRIPAPEGEKR